MTFFIWHNGTFKPADTPVYTAHDRLRLGEGIFNTMLAIDGRIHFAADHFAKLITNAAFIWPHLSAQSAAFYSETAQELLRKNNATTSQYAVNCTLTGGDNNARGLAIAEDAAPSITMRAAPFSFDTNLPIHAIISKTTRRNEHSPLANIKHAGYLDHSLALRETTKNSGNEAILLNTLGHVCCTSIASIAIIKDGQFITPPLTDGCLNGLSRTRLIKHHGAIERSIKPEELFESEGVYMVNSLRGAIPIRSINGKQIAAPSIALSDFQIDPNA
jgi:branched-chain amino acid aminotransferase